MSVKKEKQLIDLFKFCEKNGLKFEMCPEINQVWIYNFNSQGLCFHIDTKRVVVGNFGIESGSSIEKVLDKLKKLAPIWKKLKQIQNS